MRDTSSIMQIRAARALQRQIATGAQHYQRKKQLRRLLPLAPEDFRDESPATTRAIILHLAQALRDERRRGRAGHWTYDLNRHIGLAQAYRAEQERLEGMGREQAYG